MTEHESGDRTDTYSHSVDRRHFLGVGSGVGVALLAGCTGQGDGGSDDDESTDDDGSTDGETSTGSFRLLISDQPADIGDFDSLDVTFDSARVFRGEAEEEDGEEENETNESETENDEEVEETDEDEENETETADDEENETAEEGGENETEEEGGDEEAESDDEEADGYSTIDLDGATVDLTEVVGDKALGVFEGELEEGTYSKIELYASDVEGVVDGESVEVKIPSEKLQIVKSFEITADEPVSFVFDINVVKKGRTGEYNLQPVISKSGVAGKDIEVEELDRGRDDEDGDEGEAEDDDSEDEGETNSTEDTDNNETDEDEQ